MSEQRVTKIRKRLDVLRAREARILERTNRTSARRLNPENEIGGIRSESKRTKRKRAETWDSIAREHIRVRTEIFALEDELSALERGMVDAAARIVELQMHGEFPDGRPANGEYEIDAIIAKLDSPAPGQEVNE